MKTDKPSRALALISKFPFKMFIIMAMMIIGWLYLNRQKVVLFWEAYHMRNAELSRVTKLEHERKQLEQKRVLLQQTSFETERIVREKFKMKKPGERVIVIK